MRSTIVFALVIMLSTTAFVQNADAQLRENIPSNGDFSGPTIKHEDHDSGNQLFGLVDFHMGHSYEMSFMNFGGQTFNQNFYTNTMHLFFNERLTGRLDVSVAHSPFGNGLVGNQQDAQIFVRNAELNYNISDNTNIRFSFRQVPGGMYNPHGFGGYGNPFYSPHRRGGHFSPYGF